MKGLVFDAPDAQWALRKQRPTQFDSNKNRPKRQKPWPRKDEPIVEKTEETTDVPTPVS